jgi:hypothetical protein
VRSAFLSPKGLIALAVLGPLLTLATLPLEGVVSFAHSAKCFVATLLTVLVIGGLMHAFVTVTARRVWLPLSVAGGQLIVIAGLLLVLPRLAVVGQRIPEALSVFVLNGAVVLAALYLVGARGGQLIAERTRATRTDALRSRVLALQSQMNPHFLFNTLNSIASLIQLEPTLAESMVERLSGVLQYAIQAGQKSSVTLKEELDVLDDYLTIERARFGPRLRSRIDVAAELYGQPLPPMLLQPLVENAVLHGLAPREEGGEVRITGRLENDAMVLTVADDGVGLGASKRQGSRVGLTSVRERVALAFGPAGALDVRGRPGGGCECELRLPRVMAA